MRRPVEGVFRQPLNRVLRRRKATFTQVPPVYTCCSLCRPPASYADLDRAPARRLGVHDHETGWRHRGSLVVSPAVACLSGLKSAPRKRVRGNPPRVQIPPPPPVWLGQTPAPPQASHQRIWAVVSNVVSIGPGWCIFAGPQEAVEAAGQVIVDRRDYVGVAARHRGG